MRQGKALSPLIFSACLDELQVQIPTQFCLFVGIDYAHKYNQKVLLRIIYRGLSKLLFNLPNGKLQIEGNIAELPGFLLIMLSYCLISFNM